MASWHAPGTLRSDLGPSEAADVLYTLTSPEVYLLVVRTCGWEPDRYERWLRTTLRTLLLDPGTRASGT